MLNRVFETCFKARFFPDFRRLEMTWGVDIQPAYTMVGVAFGTESFSINTFWKFTLLDYLTDAHRNSCYWKWICEDNQFVHVHCFNPSLLSVSCGSLVWAGVEVAIYDWRWCALYVLSPPLSSPLLSSPLLTSPSFSFWELWIFVKKAIISLVLNCACCICLWCMTSFMRDFENVFLFVEHINRASVDPSLGLPFWDKVGTVFALFALPNLIILCDTYWILQFNIIDWTNDHQLNYTIVHRLNYTVVHHLNYAMLNQLYYMIVV